MYTLQWNFSTSELLKSRQTNAHDMSRSFHCSKCIKTFNDENFFEHHVARTHEWENCEKCPHCSKQFSWLKAHLLICSAKWSNTMKWGVGPEVTFHEGGKVGRSDAALINFFSHYEKNLKNFGETLIGVANLLPTFLPSWNGHFWSYPSIYHVIISLSHTERRKFDCLNCDKIYLDKDSLKKHMKYFCKTTDNEL